MNNNYGTFALILVTAMGLSGCVSLGANTEDDFFCEAQVGSPCTTISATDGLGAGKTISVTETVEDAMLGTLGVSSTLSEKERLGVQTSSNGGHAYDTARYRISEEISQLWIAPYLDENQLFHQARFVHFIVRDAQWATR